MDIELDHTNVVITMGGRGLRFVEAGYREPKYAIRAHGHSLFEWSLRSLHRLTTPATRLIFVCLAEHESADFVTTTSRAMGYRNVHVHELDALTDGQATSALHSRALWNPGQPLLIYNIDTYVNPACLDPAAIRPGSAGWIPCFQAPGDHWSFVEVGADGWATRVTEKQRISNHASIGLYWFANCDEYAASYAAYFSDPANLVRGERYVAPLYSHMLAKGRRVSITDLPRDQVHVLGTPAELAEFIEKPAPHWEDQQLTDKATATPEAS